MNLNTSDPMRYRSDIDLLRAFAVVTVVVYHIGAHLLPGGFVGVDIFFVISGYLITGQLEQGLERGTFGFLDFYTRRFRRLYPALCLVLVVTAVLGAFLLLPGAQNQLGREMRAVATLSVNYYFLSHENDYFGMMADHKPLLHMWSLSVEEQFYLLWPLLLWGTQQLLHGRNERLRLASDALLWMIFGVSLSWCVYSSDHYSSQAFYGMPARAWEFAVGGILALSQKRLGDRHLLGQILRWVGLAVLLVSVVRIDGSDLFPGYVVLAPVVGALLFLAGGHLDPLSLNSGGVWSRVMRHTGRISYSFYLWHWVLLAMVRSWYLERYLPRDALIGGVLSYLLAHLTYVYVEQPLRQGKTPWSRLNDLHFRHGLYAMLILYILGNVEIFHPVAPTRAQQQAARWSDDPVSMPPGCHLASSGIPLASVDACSLGHPADPVRILVWGDSHAGRLLPVLDRYTKNHPLRVLLRSYPGCPPFINTLPSGNGQDRPHCMAYANAVFTQRHQLQKLGLHGVLLDARWLLYSGPIVAGGVGLLGASRSGNYLPDKAKLLDESHALNQMSVALEEELSGLRAQNIKVAFILPEAELSVPAAECLTRFDSSVCNRSSMEFLKQRQNLVQLMQSVASQYPSYVRLLDTTRFFCDAQWCYARQNGMINFSDTDHLSVVRARSLYSFYAEIFDWLSQADGGGDEAHGG